MRMVVRQGILLVVIGAVIGIAGAMGVTRLLSSMLYGLRCYDATTFTCVVVLMVLVELIASYVPARRAAKVDPIVALRYE
jgi:putative ABC transport system permease protein